MSPVSFEYCGIFILNTFECYIFRYFSSVIPTPTKRENEDELPCTSKKIKILEDITGKVLI